MISKLNILYSFVIVFFAFLLNSRVCAQDISVSKNEKKISSDSLKKINSNLDNNFASRKKSKKDSVKIYVNSKNALKTKVDYTATDSLIFEVDNKKAFLYKESEVTNEGTKLKSGYIEVDFGNSNISAKPLKDSTGKVHEKPEFSDDKGESFNSDEMKYNFQTKRGLIKNIFTEQGDGFMHGQIVKEDSDKVSCIKNGAYTTCDLEHPHFAIQFSKAKVIPNDKIITGPAYISIEDVPTPLVLPFGFFPNQKGRCDGVIIPAYGSSATRGFFLEKGGYYFGLSDYADLSLKGDIYTRGSWGLNATSNYKKLYKYTGIIDLRYANDVIGDLDVPNIAGQTPGHTILKSYHFSWHHTQDSKANPSSTFSASVEAGSNNFNHLNSYTPTNYLASTNSSSISYNKNWSFGNLTTAIRHTQNLTDSSISVILPDVTFNVNRFYPLKSSSTVGAKKWYEEIGVSYILNSKNQLDTKDYLLFKPKTFDKLNNGVQHSIPISTSFKILKYFSLTPSINLHDWNYFKTIRKVYDTTATNNIKTDTINGFTNAFACNFSANLSTKIYGMMQFKKGKIVAIRHIITPSISFVYTPDFGASNYGYYKSFFNKSTNKFESYSIFEKGIYGGPTQSKSGALNFGFSNNLEMKVRAPKDSVNPIKKVVLIENLSITSSYDFFKDSLKLAPISISGHTILFKNLNLNYSSILDPFRTISKYGNYTRINEYEWDKYQVPLQFINTTWNVGLSWNLNSNSTFKKNKKPITNYVSDKATPEELNMINSNRDDYVDFNNPWNLIVRYNLRRYTEYTSKPTIIQTLDFTGDLSLTPKWKVMFTSGYDLLHKKMTFTTFDLIRDLHCWELRFHIIPFGFNKSYMLTINVKSSVLQDLKITKRKDWRDY